MPSGPGLDLVRLSQFLELAGELLLAGRDGTTVARRIAEGTALVSDINPGDEGSSPAFLTPDGDRILFQACDADAGCEVWATTAAGTWRVADIAPGPASSNPGPFTPALGRVFFSAATPETGIELFVLAPCGGDCDGDGAVSISELVRAVRIGLGDAEGAECSAADTNGDRRVTIDELIQAVNAALEGCG